MQDVDPKVSTPSKFFTKTFNPASFFAVNVKATTTVANRPSGTLATIIPIANIKLVTAAWNKNNILRYPTANPNTKNITPIDMAIYAIYVINAFNSFFNGVSSSSELPTNPAI